MVHTTEKACVSPRDTKTHVHALKWKQHRSILPGEQKSKFQSIQTAQRPRMLRDRKEVATDTGHRDPPLWLITAQ